MPTLGVVGTGLIGASIGTRARRDGVRVAGYDANSAALREAVTLGAVDDAVELDDLYALCETVVLAIPPVATCRELRRLNETRGGWKLLLDVASIKGSIVEAAAGVPHFVATHPFAGKEGGGPGAADATLFEGRTWAYVPSGDRALDKRFRDFAAFMGAEPFACDAERHDRVVAATSHLPQLMAYILGAQIRAADAEYERFCGPAGHEILRLSASPPDLWEEIMRQNARLICRQADAVGRDLADAARTLAAAEPNPGMLLDVDEGNGP